MIPSLDLSDIATMYVDRTSCVALSLLGEAINVNITQCVVEISTRFLYKLECCESLLVDNVTTSIISYWFSSNHMMMLLTPAENEV